MDTALSVGKDLFVACKARGNPRPRIDWFKIIGNERESLGSQLRIHSVAQSHAGHYECRARNEVDKDLSKLIKLEVLGK